MAGDYGDEAGEKMIDDFMRFGERMGERAMYERAHRIQRAFENATQAANPYCLRVSSPTWEKRTKWST